MNKLQSANLLHFNRLLWPKKFLLGVAAICARRNLSFDALLMEILTLTSLCLGKTLVGIANCDVLIPCSLWALNIQVFMRFFT
jgi:hypothetical protein